MMVVEADRVQVANLVVDSGARLVVYEMVEVGSR